MQLLGVDWLSLVLLAGLAYRATRLVGWDDITHPLRVAATGLTDDKYHKLAQFVDEQQQRDVDPWELDYGETSFMPVSRRVFYIAKLIHCPWCVGFWVSIATTVLYYFAPTQALWFGVAATLSVIIGLVAKHLD